MRIFFTSLLLGIALTLGLPVQAKEDDKKPSKEIVLSKEDVKDLSLAQADETIAGKTVENLELQLKMLTERLTQAREYAEGAKVRRQGVMRDKLVKAGISEVDIPNWSGSTNTEGQLVLHRTEPSKIPHKPSN